MGGGGGGIKGQLHLHDKMHYKRRRSGPVATAPVRELHFYSVPHLEFCNPLRLLARLVNQGTGFGLHGLLRSSVHGLMEGALRLRSHSMRHAVHVALRRGLRRALRATQGWNAMKPFTLLAYCVAYCDVVRNAQRKAHTV